MRITPRWYMRKKVKREKTQTVQQQNGPTITDLASFITSAAALFYAFQYMLNCFLLNLLEHGKGIRYFYPPDSLQLGINNPFHSLAFYSILIAFIVTIMSYSFVPPAKEFFEKKGNEKVLLAAILLPALAITFVVQTNYASDIVKMATIFVTLFIGIAFVPMKTIPMFIVQVSIALLFISFYSFRAVKDDYIHQAHQVEVACESERFKPNWGREYVTIVYDNGDIVEGEVVLVTESDVIFKKEQETIVVSRSKPKMINFGELPARFISSK